MTRMAKETTTKSPLVATNDFGMSLCLQIIANLSVLEQFLQERYGEHSNCNSIQFKKKFILSGDIAGVHGRDRYAHSSLHLKTKHSNCKITYYVSTAAFLKPSIVLIYVFVFARTDFPRRPFTSTGSYASRTIYISTAIILFSI